MKNILLVEDENVVRISLKSIFDWEYEGFNIKYEANNGKQALMSISIHNDIDIVITDINMPVMDGITLIENIRKMYGDLPIIVLSGYNDFELVRRAFKLGIYDYIIKSDIDSQKILVILKNIINKKKNNNYIVNDKRDFLENLIYCENIENLKDQIVKYNFRFHQKNLFVCCVLIDNFENIKERYNDNLKRFSKSINHIIDAELINFDNGEVISVNSKKYAIVLSFDTTSKAKNINRVNFLTRKIRHNISNLMNISISIGISSCVCGYENLNKLYKEASFNARYRFVVGKGKNIFPEQVYKTGLVKSISIGDYKKTIFEVFKSLNKKKIFKELKKILEQIGTYRYDNINEIYSLYIELIYIIISCLSKINNNSYNIFEHNTDFDYFIRKLETEKEINQWILNLVENSVDYLINEKNNNESYTISKVKKYIDNNYYKKLTLHEVSEYVELSEGYLSTLFTQETGENFIQYLTRIRVNKAQDLLLNTNLKIYEICYKVGYENVEHFSRVYKKQMGKSPLKSRKNKYDF